MGIQLKSLGGVLAIAVASTLASAKIAQADPYRFHPIADEFNRRFFESSGDFFYNVSFPGYVGDLLGIGSPRGLNAFPEKEVERDANRVYALYREVLDRQLTSSPILRVPDAVNPFESSLMGLPSTPVSTPPFSNPNYVLDGQPLQ